ncbi:MAG: DUF1559 domain-containing protein [Planctomycetes bacterium]|nr:DUF1559 domain-containing protein [Planctomycetota bacterium]
MRVANPRSGVTLVEVLVVTAITAVLIGLLLVGVMKVRESANIAQSKDNLRQIVLATQNYAANHKGALPKLGPIDVVRDSRGSVTSLTAIKGSPSLFIEILAYLDAQQPTRKKGKYHAFPIFLSPSDPTAGEALAKDAAVSSYAANAEVFLENPNLARTFTDGSSSTIAFAEHYAYNCNGHNYPYWLVGRATNLLYGGHSHRPSFADVGDIVPVTSGNPPVSMPSYLRHTPPVTTFQVAPSIKHCRSFLAQTPHPGGMLVAMADGAVRQLAPGIAPTTFWALVTPAGGEALGEW